MANLTEYIHNAGRTYNAGPQPKNNVFTQVSAFLRRPGLKYLAGLGAATIGGAYLFHKIDKTRKESKEKGHGFLAISSIVKRVAYGTLGAFALAHGKRAIEIQKIRNEVGHATRGAITKGYGMQILGYGLLAAGTYHGVKALYHAGMSIAGQKTKEQKAALLSKQEIGMRISKGRLASKKLKHK